MSRWLTGLRPGGVLGLGAAMFILGGAVGLAVRGTSFDPVVFEALDTWVGGIGTVLAILVAARIFSVEQTQRREAIESSDESADQAAIRVQARITKAFATADRPPGFTTLAAIRRDSQ